MPGLPMMSAVEVSNRMIPNEEMLEHCLTRLKERRAAEIRPELMVDSRERCLNFDEDGGRRILDHLYNNKFHLTELTAGTYVSKNVGFPESEDLSKSFRVARADGVIQLDRMDKPFLPIADWLAALMNWNGKNGWRDITEENLMRVRQCRIHSKRTLQMALANTHECTFGHIHEDLADFLIDIMEKGRLEDSKLLTGDAMSLDTESVQIPEAHYNAMRSPEVYITKGKGEWMANNRKNTQLKVHKTQYRNQLATIMIGNGTSWNIIIHCPIRAVEEREKTGEIRVKYNKVPLQKGCKKLLEYLSNVKVVVGCGVDEDLSLIQKTIWGMYQVEWTPPKALDLTTLMYIAGYSGSRFNMQTIAYLVLGVVMNKRASCVDSRWTWIFKDLKRMDGGLSVIWYGLSDILVGFNIAVVLLNWLFLEAYPDPALVMMSIDPTPTEGQWKQLFLATLMKLVGDSKPDDRRVQDLEIDRRKIITAVLGHTTSAERLFEFLPWAINGVFGGPRFIEPVREHFATTQVPLLLKLFFVEIRNGTLPVVLKEKKLESENWVFQTMMGHRREPPVTGGTGFHTVLDAEQPGVQHRGLSSHPLLKGIVSSIAEANTLNDVIRMRDDITQRRVRRKVPLKVKGKNPVKFDTYTALMEGAYLHPQRIPIIVAALEKEYNDSIIWEENGTDIKSSRTPELAKHEMLRKLYTTMTGKETGTPLWATIKVKRQSKELESQRKALRADSLRTTRVRVMEVVKDKQADGVGSIRGSRIAEVYDNIPVTVEAKKINKKKAKRNIAKAMRGGAGAPGRRGPVSDRGSHLQGVAPPPPTGTGPSTLIPPTNVQVAPTEDSVEWLWKVIFEIQFQRGGMLFKDFDECSRIHKALSDENVVTQLSFTFDKKYVEELRINARQWLDNNRPLVQDATHRTARKTNQVVRFSEDGVVSQPGGSNLPVLERLGERMGRPQARGSKSSREQTRSRSDRRRDYVEVRDARERLDHSRSAPSGSHMNQGIRDAREILDRVRSSGSQSSQVQYPPDGLDDFEDDGSGPSWGTSAKKRKNKKKKAKNNGFNVNEMEFYD